MDGERVKSSDKITKEQLINELGEARKRVYELETMDREHSKTEKELREKIEIFSTII